ncbi:MAG: hypothetical protein ABJB11_11380 [Ferruginibacter sp.]
MKKIYTAGILISTLLFSGCSKDFLKSYDTRILGTWKITDVNRIGLGGSSANLPFTSGTFTFFSDGQLTYVNSANVTFKGSWDIVKKYQDDQTLRSLQITAVDFTNQQVLSQYYDDMNFTSTNHFKATVNSTFHTYVTHFRR